MKQMINLLFFCFSSILYSWRKWRRRSWRLNFSGIISSSIFSDHAFFAFAYLLFLFNLFYCFISIFFSVRLEEVYESHSEIYLVQELCLGGELFDRLDEQPDYHYTEAECARLVKNMLNAVRYLHSKGIIHR